MALVVLAGSTASASAAQSTGLWLPAASRAGPNAFAPTLAVNARGDAVVGWQGPFGPGARSDRAELATRVAGGPFLPPQRLISGFAMAPTLSVSQVGAAFAISQVFDDNYVSQLWAAGGSAAAPFGPAQPVSEPGRYSPAVAIDEGGNAIAAWEDPASMQLLAAWRPAGQAFEPAVVLDPKTRSAPAVAFDAFGTGVVAWTRQPASNSAPAPVMVSLRAAGGGWTAPQTISDPTHFTFGAPAIATNRRGDSLVAWPTSVGGPAFPFSRSVEMSLRRGGGTFDPPQTLTSSSGLLLDPRPAIDESGNALLVWSTGGGLAGAYAPAGRGLSPADQLPGQPQSYSYAVGFDATGAALVLSLTNGNDAIRRVIVSAGRVGHPFSAAKTLFQSPQPPYAPNGYPVVVAQQQPLRLGFDGLGRGLAVWANQPEGQVFSMDYLGAAGLPVIEAASVASPGSGRPRLQYRLRSAAKVEIALDRCHGRRIATCPTHRRVRRFTTNAHKGTNTTSLGQGRQSRLANGRYRAVLIARPRGLRAETRKVLFTVKHAS
jgi:hypothetical protein